MKTKPFTQKYREQLIELCLSVSEEIGDPVPESKLRAMSDVELDLESDWYWELSLK
jgi:hypothetical protein